MRNKSSRYTWAAALVLLLLVVGVLRTPMKSWWWWWWCAPMDMEAVNGDTAAAEGESTADRAEMSAVTWVPVLVLPMGMLMERPVCLRDPARVEGA